MNAESKTSIPLVDLKAQYNALKPEIDEAIATVIRETAFVGNLSNRFVQGFETAFSQFLGKKHVIGCGNGTDSLEILLKAAGIGHGDEVVVPAVSWIATSEAVSNAGATPVFVDIDRNTYTISIDALANAVTPRTKAVIPVHLYGRPADMDGVLRIADRHKLFVLEDCAQAHAALYKGRMVGTLGHAASFSFFPGKNLGAYGDAGGMATDDDALAEKARMIAQHGQVRAKHDHKIEGRNSRLDGIQAAILGVKLPKLLEWTQARRRHAAAYRSCLASSGFQLQEDSHDIKHVYHLMVIQVSNRDFAQKALKDVGINTAIQYPQALPLLSAYSSRGLRADQYPNAVSLTRRCLSLPMFPELSEPSIQYICEHLLQFAKP